MARILIIDDEELVRASLRKILQTIPHDVTDTGNGENALTWHRSNPFDLVITDIIMPEKEGIEIIIELKTNFPDLPIIAISGGGPDRHIQYLESAKAFGVEHVLAKPFSSKEFLKCVDNCLST